MYADDSVAWFHHKNQNNLIEIMSQELMFVKNWLTANKLTLNVNKTKFLLFTKNSLTNHTVNIDGVYVDRVTEIEFLGVIFQSNLKWREHIKYISIKLNKLNSMLYLIRNKLTRDSLRLIYHSIAYSYISYCHIIWGNTFKPHLKPIHVAHKPIIRTIT